MVVPRDGEGALREPAERDIGPGQQEHGKRSNLIMDILRHRCSLAECNASTGVTVCPGDALSIDPTTSCAGGGGHKERVAGILSEMDEAKINVSIPLQLDEGHCLGKQPDSIEEEDEVQADLGRAHCQRVSYLGVDPARRDVSPLFEDAPKQWGTTGKTVNGCSGFRPVWWLQYNFARSCCLLIASHAGSKANLLVNVSADPVRANTSMATWPTTSPALLHAGVCCRFTNSSDLAIGRQASISILLSGNQTLSKMNSHSSKVPHGPVAPAVFKASFVKVTSAI